MTWRKAHLRKFSRCTVVETLSAALESSKLVKSHVGSFEEIIEGERSSIPTPLKVNIYRTLPHRNYSKKDENYRIFIWYELVSDISSSYTQDSDREEESRNCDSFGWGMKKTRHWIQSDVISKLEEFFDEGVEHKVRKWRPEKHMVILQGDFR